MASCQEVCVSGIGDLWIYYECSVHACLFLEACKWTAKRIVSSSQSRLPTGCFTFLASIQCTRNRMTFSSPFCPQPQIPRHLPHPSFHRLGSESPRKREGLPNDSTFWSRIRTFFHFFLPIDSGGRRRLFFVRLCVCFTKAPSRYKPTEEVSR